MCRSVQRRWLSDVLVVGGCPAQRGRAGGRRCGGCHRQVGLPLAAMPVRHRLAGISRIMVATARVGGSGGGALAVHAGALGGGLGAGAAFGVVAGEGRLDRVLVGEGGGEDDGVLDGLPGALAAVRAHRVRGVAQKCHSTADVGRQRVQVVDVDVDDPLVRGGVDQLRDRLVPGRDSAGRSGLLVVVAGAGLLGGGDVGPVLAASGDGWMRK